jgi:hypothetical protein
LDIDSPYALFSLFISEEMFEYIAKSTNEYAQQKQAENQSPTQRVWKDTTPLEIKVSQLMPSQLILIGI